MSANPGKIDELPSGSSSPVTRTFNGEGLEEVCGRARLTLRLVPS